jgi:hypothetical protein
MIRFFCKHFLEFCSIPTILALDNYGDLNLSSSLIAHTNTVSALDVAPSRRVLINSYQHRYPDTFHKNLLSIRLTELYESLFIGGNTIKTPYPHFQVYKLWLISYFLDLGQFNLALKYLQNIYFVIKGCEPKAPFLSPLFLQRLQEYSDRLTVCCSDLNHSNDKKDHSSTGGWLGKISSNLTGAALGRGLEQLMNSAVGVEENSFVSTNPKRKTLFPLPGDEVDRVASPALSMAKVSSGGNPTELFIPPSNSSAYAPSEASIGYQAPPPVPLKTSPNPSRLGPYQPPHVPAFNGGSSISYPASYENIHDSLNTYSTPNLLVPNTLPQPANPAQNVTGNWQPQVPPNKSSILHDPPVSQTLIHPVNNDGIPQPDHQSVQSYDEDLGFGNSSLKKPKAEVHPSQPTTAKPEHPTKAENTPAKKDVPDSESKGVV